MSRRNRPGAWAFLAVLLLAVGCGGGAGGEGERPAAPKRALVAELAAALDPNVPGLAPFFQAWEAGEAERAEERLLAYFRDRPVPAFVRPEPLPVEQPVLVSALEAWRGKFSFQGATARAATPDGPIDWSHRGPNDDNEWTWFLHRHYYLREMLALYRAQGHPEFVERIRAYLLDWFWKFPPPDHRSFSPAWRALEAARRIADAWLPLYDGLRDHPAFGDEATLAVLAGAARHADYLRRHHHFGGNHLVTEMMALATIAAAWPEFRRAGEWMDYAVDRALAEMDRQVYPDGAHKELANHYQWVAGSSFQRLFGLVVGAGRTAAAERMRAGMERIWDYYARVTRPDGTGPLNNDSDLEPNAEQLLPLARTYGREDWLHVATAGRAGEAPEDGPSAFFPWAGHAVLRDGWDRRADWLFFDRGPFGTDHHQEDRLHVSVALGGRNLLVDSGRYVYRDDAWSRFFRSPLAHNVPTFGRHRRVVPDPTTPRPAETGLRRSGPLVHSAGWMPLAEGTAWSGRHARAVVLGPGFAWIVDRVETARADRATFRWRFAPGLVPEGGGASANPSWEIREGGRTVARWSLDTAAAVVAGRVAGRGPPAIQGWYSPEFNERLPNEVLEIEAPVGGVTTFSWLLATAEVSEELSHDTAGEGAVLEWTENGKTRTWRLGFSGGRTDFGASVEAIRNQSPARLASP